MEFYETTLFDSCFPQFKIDKPIRLIELFAGVGSQAMALRNLGLNFESYKVVEFNKYPLASYNAIFGTNYVPTDITKINGDYLNIVDVDKYIYIMTYSFPCQDLSVAGKQQGMSKGSGTRSGLLWEVERLLNEVENLPQVLLMENVPQVIGKKNINDFNLWRQFLESKGYSNFVKVLNAKDYGIPQNRNRCFMVSLLGEYSYTFPQKQELKLKLKDLLEDNVDEKYFLSDKMLDYVLASPDGYCVDGHKIINRDIAVAKTTREGNTRCALSDYVSNQLSDNFDGECLRIKNNTKQGYLEAKDGDGIYISPTNKRGTVQKESIPTLTTFQDKGVVIKANEYEE